PCRTSLMTGRPPRTFGTHVNNLTPTIPAGTPTIGRILADSGYDTAYVGKWHVPIAPESTAIHGFSVTRDLSSGGPHDALFAAPCEEILKQSRTKPLFMMASIIDPHDICEYAMGAKLPNGGVSPAPALEDCPPLPANHALLPDEPEALLKIKEIATKV